MVSALNNCSATFSSVDIAGGETPRASRLSVYVIREDKCAHSTRRVVDAHAQDDESWSVLEMVRTYPGADPGFHEGRGPRM